MKQSNIKQTLLWITAVFCLSACGQAGGSGIDISSMKKTEKVSETMNESSNLPLATFGAGCFWCVEAVFQRINGVVKVESGYMGGHVSNPTYRQICTGQTGHAEVIQVTFDPQAVSYSQLLEVFWASHDPTTLNRQGGDTGTQYRSVIFTHSEEQLDQAKASMEKRNRDTFGGRIVTQLEPAQTFYKAEGYHQNYFNENKEAGYCRIVILPKLEKLGLED